MREVPGSIEVNGLPFQGREKNVGTINFLETKFAEEKSYIVPVPNFAHTLINGQDEIAFLVPHNVLDRQLVSVVFDEQWPVRTNIVK